MATQEARAAQRRSSALLEPGRKRQSSGQATSLRSAQHFQLDQCLSAKAMDKIIYSLTSAAETRQSE